MIEFRFEEKQFEDLKNFAFRGLLLDEDSAYKFAYLVGSILDQKEVFVSIQDDQSELQRYSLKIDRSLDDCIEDVSSFPDSSESN